MPQSCPVAELADLVNLTSAPHRTLTRSGSNHELAHKSQCTKKNRYCAVFVSAFAAEITTFSRCQRPCDASIPTKITHRASDRAVPAIFVHMVVTPPRRPLKSYSSWPSGSSHTSKVEVRQLNAVPADTLPARGTVLPVPPRQVPWRNPSGSCHRSLQGPPGRRAPPGTVPP
jgi:hypothetical protein